MRPDFLTGRRVRPRFSGRASALVVIVCLLAACATLLAPVARPQASLAADPPPPASPPPAPAPPPSVPVQPPAPPAPAPFPTQEPGLTGTGTPPEDVFYVSPEGTDAPPVAPNLACLPTAPCRTITFALSQAHDGDAVSLAGGTYPVASPIEVNKLVTIAPNGLAPGSTTTAQQSASNSTTCAFANLTTYTCSTSLSVAVLAGSLVTLTVSGATGQTVSIITITPVGTPTSCTATITSAAGSAASNTAIATILCPAGRSIPVGSTFQVTVQVTGGPAGAAPPTLSVSVTAATTSTRPVVESEGGAIFHITAVGSAALHATIFGLTIGNASAIGSNAAILLDNDSYTEVAHNVIGAEDLPNAIGILLTTSDHPDIHDNTIQGSTLFPRTSTVAVGTPEGGFGVVTEECLGSINHSNGVQLVNNLFAKNSNAGVWFCSNGTGGFFVSQNTMHANGRGILLEDAVDTYISGNIISDNILDGIDVLQSSERNIITGNTIESQQTPTSAGILLAGHDVFIPLGNQITQNLIHRNTADVVVVGAEGTHFTDNSITAVGTNTGILFATAIPGWSAGQPLSTVLASNALQASGDCAATTGCAIRLTEGVTDSIDASSGNDWGVSAPSAIQAEIWDNGRDPSLGIVYVQVAPPPPTPIVGLGITPTPTPPPTPLPAVVAPAPSVTGGTIAGPPTTASPVTATPTPAPAATPGPATSTVTSGQATSYLDPSAGYYVEVSFTVDNSSGNPVSSDALTLNFFAADGTALGSTSVTTSSSGGFSGDVQPSGSGRLTQPTRLVVTDTSGATMTFTVNAGTPATRPAPGPIQ